MAHVNGRHFRIVRVSPKGITVVLRGSRRELEWQLEKLNELRELTKGKERYRYYLTSLERLNQLGVEYTKQYN